MTHSRLPLTTIVIIAMLAGSVLLADKPSGSASSSSGSSSKPSGSQSSSSGSSSSSASKTAKAVKPTAPTWHKMRVFVEWAALAKFAKDKKNAEARNFLTTVLFPSIVEHFQQTYQIYAPAKNVITMKKCGSIDNLGKYLNKQLEGDLFLFLTANDKKSDKLVEIVPCMMDVLSGRVLTAEVKLNVFHKDDMKPDNLNDLYELAIRKIYRLIAFDAKYFDKFVKAGTTTKLAKTDVVKDFGKSKFKTQVVLKPVLDYAKTYYKCKTLTGMPLENKAGAKTQWEKSVAANDIMGSSGYTNPKLSKLTLNFMKGTGWFKPNMDMAEHFTWGFEAGCDLFSADCKKMKYTCKEKTHLCSPDFTSKGQCLKDDEAEKCPLFHEDTKGDCRMT